MKASGIVDMASDVVKSAVSRQDEITVVEAGNMWNKLLARYDSIENILVLMNYVKDEDLRKETQIVLKKIRQQSEQLAKLMAEYSVSTIPRPASEIKISVGEPSFTDRYIFARIFQNIKWLLPVHIVSFIQSTSPKVRKMFKGFLLEEMDMYDRLRDFGLKKTGCSLTLSTKVGKTNHRKNLRSWKWRRCGLNWLPGIKRWNLPITW